jgi:hypothetical protein
MRSPGSMTDLRFYDVSQKAIGTRPSRNRANLIPTSQRPEILILSIKERSSLVLPPRLLS